MVKASEGLDEEVDGQMVLSSSTFCSIRVQKIESMIYQIESVAERIKNKSVGEVFELENDFTPEEHA